MHKLNPMNNEKPQLHRSALFIGNLIIIVHCSLLIVH